MLKMSRLTEYAFLLVLALNKSKKPLSADVLAKKTHLESPTVSKILKRLKKSGLLLSKRGSGGGYLLIKEQTEISMFEVIQAMEGSIGLTDCVTSKEKCRLNEFCGMAAGMQKVSAVIAAALHQVAVSELVSEVTQIELNIKD